jgi:hypothetical protein
MSPRASLDDTPPPHSNPFRFGTDQGRDIPGLDPTLWLESGPDLRPSALKALDRSPGNGLDGRLFSLSPLTRVLDARGAPASLSAGLLCGALWDRATPLISINPG